MIENLPRRVSGGAFMFWPGGYGKPIVILMKEELDRQHRKTFLLTYIYPQ
ncbi:hypothetical protein C772_01880 [Bhargavaea cecembensis DSE10]|uniref:Uncharacterized protein n=1 Tax=Bhargavaea cecembensis DSE10 TaxID=1235279 RepID=M7NX61_9BACL|nr:hypothetical protein C772_01880 [Bhargavaea cecembensis DSE10]